MEVVLLTQGRWLANPTSASGGFSDKELGFLQLTLV